jgi:hypothetical protein
MSPAKRKTGSTLTAKPSPTWTPGIGEPKLVARTLAPPSPPISRPQVKKLLVSPNEDDRSILDFDIETRRIGFFTAGKFGPDGCEPIAIAWSWVGTEDIHVRTLEETPLPEMLLWFKQVYDLADIVTGHYIRRFDLPIINGSLMEHRLPLLGEKRAWDTKLEMIKKAGIGASQENLSMMYELAEQKFSMSDHRWRQAARLTKEGMAAARTRVVDDVIQHKQLRLVMIEEGALKSPKLWKP